MSPISHDRFYVLPQSTVSFVAFNFFSLSLTHTLLKQYTCSPIQLIYIYTPVILDRVHTFIAEVLVTKNIGKCDVYIYI